MNDQMIIVTRLRDRASKCRTLARQALSDGIAIELESLACDYDGDAARLEACEPDRLPSMVRSLR